MGGDHGCEVVIDGIRLALQAYPAITEMHVVGDQKAIEAALVRSRLKDPRVNIIHASEVLGMDEKPLTAVRRKRDSSVVRAAELVRVVVCHTQPVRRAEARPPLRLLRRRARRGVRPALGPRPLSHF